MQTVQAYIGRKMRGNLIMAFRLIKGLEHVEQKDSMVRDNGRTREREQHLGRTGYRKDIKKFGFPNRISETWSSQDMEIELKPCMNLK